MATKHRIIHGDCLKKLPKFDDNSIDALCTDPPAGINFMNKEWDKNRGGRECWVMWLQEIMEQCYRVLKPGSHGFVWAIPRTSHWTATALEDAGFEIRDIITHLFGSGFPKSLNISKSIDKAAGAERSIDGHEHRGTGVISVEPVSDGGGQGISFGMAHAKNGVRSKPLTTPSTPEAKQWDGWGTALKPASEHWILIRKPLSEKTVAKNILKWGVGGLNIDACRVEGKYTNQGGGSYATGKFANSQAGRSDKDGLKHIQGKQTQGRFPANLILDDVAGELLDAQSGFSKTPNKVTQGASNNTGMYGHGKGLHAGLGVKECYGDKGGASRFFYCAKPSKRERNAGLDLERETVDDGRNKKIDNPFLRGKTERINTHPTVKSIQLMRYLCRLITPPKGIILDPFMGSGTTGCAAVKEGFSFIGIELDKKDCQISRSRIQYASQHRSD